MSDITYVADHVKRAQAYLTSKFQKPRIRALTAAIVDGVQWIEDLAFDLLVSSTLTAATGLELDLWGKIVGERRGRLKEADYRRVISARIKANLSEGDADRLIEVFSVLTNADGTRYFEHFPAGFRLTAYRSSFMGDSIRARTREIMQEIKPAGVAMSLVESVPGNLILSSGDFPLGSTLSRTI